MDVSVPGRHDDLKILNGIVPEPDIVGNRILKEDDILIHHRDGTGQDLSGDLLSGFSVKEDPPAPGPVKPGDQLRERGFSAARRPDEGHAAPWLKGQAEILDDRRRKPGVAEGHMLHHQPAGQLGVNRIRFAVLTRLFPVSASFLRFRVGSIVHHVLDPLHLRTHFLQGLPHGHQGLKRGEEGLQKALEGEQRADRKFAPHDQKRAKKQHGRARQGLDQSGNRRQKTVFLRQPDV